MASALRFAANLGWLFTELEFVRRFEAAARAGLEAVEIADPYHWPADQLRTWLDDADLQLVLVNSPMGATGDLDQWGSACLPTSITQFRSGVMQALDLAAELGVGLVHIPAGAAPRTLGLPQALEQYRANIAWAAGQATRYGVDIVIEPINRRTAPRFVLANLEAAAEVIAAIDSDHVGLLFDFFHVQMTQGNLIENFRTYQHLIKHVQIADVPGRHEPGTGEINYSMVFRALERLDYDGWIGCEYRPRLTSDEGLQWLRRRRESSKSTTVS